jgi:3-oxoacyl-[acyl-carrier protein] reductase
MSRLLQGKVALIAGASQGGTGTGCAIRLAAEGVKVAICARTVEKMQETIQGVEAVGGTGVMFECDLSDPDGGRDRLIARTEEELGSIDYLVYVAALGTYAKFETLSLDKLQKGLEVNLKAAWLLNQQVVESLRARNAEGAIVNMGQGRPGRSRDRLSPTRWLRRPGHSTAAPRPRCTVSPRAWRPRPTNRESR